jgi:microcystin-dependent protein
MSYLIQFRNDTAANWATANTILAAGEAGFDVTNQILKVGTGVTPWSSLQGISLATGGGAPGIISQFAGATAPPGYLLCDGAAVSRSTYSSLFTTIGTAYGAGNGTTTFNLPNLQNRIPVGKGPDTEFDTLGETGGAKEVTLSSSQIPAHSHPNTLSDNTVASSGHSHGPGSYAAGIGATNNNIAAIGYVASFVRGGGPGQSTYTITGGIGGAQNFNHYTPVYGDSAGPSGTTTVGITNANNTGGGGAHTNLQPYIVVNYIIKT